MIGLAPICGFAFSLLTGAFLIFAKPMHTSHTLDRAVGIQKIHTQPTLRVGGIALMIGAIAGGFYLDRAAFGIWTTVCLCSLPAFMSGLAEDLSKRVGAKWRLIATLFAGQAVVQSTGFRIDRIGIPGADFLLSFQAFAVFFTAFAIAGVANAINIIDGINGLATGVAIINLIALASLAQVVGDQLMLQLCLLTIAVLAGFFILNFPFGRIFLGDAGAYSAGFVVATLAVAVPYRNPVLSPLVGLLVVAYPVVETVVTIQRRLGRNRGPVGQPDRLHLHSLIFRRNARSMTRTSGFPFSRHILTCAVVLTLPILSAWLALLTYDEPPKILVGLAAVGVVYIFLYRRVALLPLVPGISSQSKRVPGRPGGVR